MLAKILERGGDVDLHGSLTIAIRPQASQQVADERARDCRRRSQAKGAEANRLSPSTSERYVVMCCPRTLLPAASRGGENVPRPPLPGDTVTMPPATPLL